MIAQQFLSKGCSPALDLFQGIFQTYQKTSQKTARWKRKVQEIGILSFLVTGCRSQGKYLAKSILRFRKNILFFKEIKKSSSRVFPGFWLCYMCCTLFWWVIYIFYNHQEFAFILLEKYFIIIGLDHLFCFLFFMCFMFLTKIMLDFPSCCRLPNRIINIKNGRTRSENNPIRSICQQRRSRRANAMGSPFNGQQQNNSCKVKKTKEILRGILMTFGVIQSGTV